MECLLSKDLMGNPSNLRLVQQYINDLQAELAEEKERKESLSVERAKLKVCWEMTLEELFATKTELLDKIAGLENELHKQTKKRRILQKLLDEYGKNMKEMRGIIDNINPRNTHPSKPQVPENTMAEEA